MAEGDVADSTLTLRVDRMAHGGEGIATDAAGRVVFVAGAVPGDLVRAEVVKAKKRWARARLVEVVEAGPIRVPYACPAAAAGAGCCDFSHVAPAAQLELKLQVLRGQLTALAGRSGVLGGIDLSEIETRELSPNLGWRTRVRLGVDAAGNAGVRLARSGEVLASEHCAQPVSGLLDGLIARGGAPARTFQPGSEVVAVMDATGTRHVVETARVQRGRRVEAIETVVEGSGEVTERIGEAEFRFPATAFWQAHLRAPETYAAIIREWGEGDYLRGDAWDLYGGVGAFAPAIHAATGGARVHSVDYSPSATVNPQPALRGLPVEVHRGRVEGVVGKLPGPGLVVLDPPRAGAGADVISAVAQAGPERVIHIGCDPATLARDLATWAELGYRATRIVLVDAFPATHHFETIVQLAPPHV